MLARSVEIVPHCRKVYLLNKTGYHHFISLDYSITHIDTIQIKTIEAYLTRSSRLCRTE